MSAKSLMVNEGLLQELEVRIATLRDIGGALVKRFSDPKFSYAEGVSLESEYDESGQVLQELAKQLFVARDLTDPEDNELCRREEEDEEEEDGEGDDEEEQDEDEDDDEDAS